MLSSYFIPTESFNFCLQKNFIGFQFLNPKRRYLYYSQQDMPKKGYMCPPSTGKQKYLPVGEQRFNDVSYTSDTFNYFQHLNRDIQYLRKILSSWSIVSQNYLIAPKQRDLLCNYLRAYHEYTEFDQFDSNFFVLSTFDVNLERIQNIDLIYKSFNIFKKCKWPVRFDTKFISRITECNINQIKYILSFVMLLADGHFLQKLNIGSRYGWAKPLQTKTFPYNRFFSVKIFKQKNMLVHIGVQKIPVVSKGNVIKRYEYCNYINILDILGDQMVQNPKKLQERMSLFYDKILNDVARKDHSEQLQIDSTKISKQLNYFHYDDLNPYTEQKQTFQTPFNSTEARIFHPLQFKVYYVSAAQTSTLVFDQKMKRWISQDYLDRVQRKKLNEYQRKINEELIKRFVDFQSAKTLVQLLTKIPNFKVKLTQQQKDVIGENGNVMVIGRSGTGKTTCSVLRLFSIEMLFKIRLSLFKKKFQNQIANTRCSSDDIDKAIGLHCIFLTASPVLINQIQRYYKKLTTNIKEQLQKKRKKVEAQRKRKQAQQNIIKQQNNEDDQSLNQITQESKGQTQEEEIEQVPEVIQRAKSREVIQEETEMGQQLKGLKLQDDLQNQDFNQDEQDFDKIKDEFQQKIKRYQSLEDLQQTDYPGFFTVKSYIMMIDGCLPKPFFIRNKTTNAVLDQESKAAWHNQRKGVMMIENYFRNEDNENKEDLNEKMMGQIEEEINYSDEEQLEHQYMRQIQLKANKEKQQLTKKLMAKKTKNQMSFQVDFEYFATYFWPNVNRRFYSSRNITPQLVWTQIYSTIKGSASSHLYSGQYLPEKVYLTQSSNVFLTKDQKLDIYETFCQYQRWKIKNGGYDIMDAVNYNLNIIRFRGYTGPEIHYVMIDEVQDLPHSIIYLLSKTASYGVFYSGDTAQTIAKGVGFRFCDLKSLFDERQFDNSLQLKKPIVKHLTINFRSHNNILQLANSVVSCLQILFPKTIDKLAKERSDLEGPKPMILAQNDEQLLFYVLCGDDQKKQNAAQGMKKPPLQFGCDQVIIVRDQDSKQKVPGMLQHALCLTIYQAKGLQFNDVILFNFFTQCKHPQKWNLLKYLKVVDYEISKQEYEKSITRHKQEEEQAKNSNDKENQIKQNQQPEQMATQFNVEQKNDTVKIKKIVSDVKKIMKDINDYAQLCSDLKLFYTAITRPRKTLIIYDQDPSCRKLVEKMWENLGVIQIVTKQLIQSELLNPNKSQSNDKSIFKRIINATDSNQWKKQGLKMYSRGYFEQAMKCFQKSQNQELFKKAKANLLADKATKLLIEVQSERDSIKQGFMAYRNLSNSELSKIKKKLKHNESKSYSQFNLAGQLFEDLKMHKQAGQCYFSGKMFQIAKKQFLQVKMFKQAAQSSQVLEEYKEAAALYDQDEDYLKVIECLDMINEWQEILKMIKKYETKMSQVQKQSLLKKYAALALEALVYQVQFQNEQNTQNKPQDKKQNKPQNNRIEIIQQKQSDQEEDFDSDESGDQDQMQEVDPEKQAEQIYNKRIQIISYEAKKQQQEIDALIKEDTVKVEAQPQMVETVYQKIESVQEQKPKDDQSFSDLNQSNKQQPKSEEIQQEIKQTHVIDQKMLQTVKDNVEDQSFSDLNESKTQLKQEINQKQPASQESFSDLNNVSQDFSDLNAKYEKQLDPDIQSIKSLIDSQDPWLKSALSQISPKSQYSIIDQAQSYNMNVKIIKTKGNIFIQDQIMQKIIRIVSLINQSSTTFLQQFKGYQSLITVNKDQNSENVIKSSQITDFEDIDSQTINVVLDTLQSFKLYKLCLFVCNRYHLPQKAGRYLISIMMKYSTNCQANTLINSGLLAPSTQRKSQLQKGILGSIAVHSILENVNSEFLKIKISSNQAQNKQKNTLGTYFIQGLMLQGFYKKTVFMVNPQQALHILDNFCDYNLFRDIAKNKFIKMEQNQVFLSQKPKTQAQIKFSLFSMRYVINKYQVSQRMDIISYRYYKQFGIYDQINLLKQLTVPDYLPFTKNIIQNNEEGLYVFLDNQLSLSYKKLTRGDQIETTDTVLGLLSILHNDNLQSQLFRNCTLKSFLEYYRCIKYLRNIIYKLDGPNSLNIIKSVLVFYQCKLIENYKSMNFIGSGYCFLNRTSNMANQLIEQAKTDTQIFAYFFQQDFNFIMCKISTVINIIKNKFDHRLTKFIKNRSNLNRFQRKTLPDDYLLHNQQLILIEALKESLNLISSKQDKYAKKQIQKKKNQQIKPKFDYKTHGKIQHAYIINQQDLSDQDPTEIKVNYTRDGFVLPDFSLEMTYLAQEMLSIFTKKSKQCKQAAVGKQLYCANLNSYYREYIQKIGGYNLYDAIEFKKFKRVDLYADNILSVIDTLPIIDKHVYTAEILILLLVQYKKKIQKEQFTLKMSSDHLKFFEGLKYVDVLGNDLSSIEQKDLAGVSDDLHESISLDKKKFLFSYKYQYASELNQKQLVQVICDYLQILSYEQRSQFVNLVAICMLYVVNIQPTNVFQNSKLYEKLRKVITLLASAWDTPLYKQLSKSKNLTQFIEIRQNIMKKPKPLHQIKVTCTGDIDKIVEQSQTDYKIQTKIIQGRKKALNKILVWWKKNKTPIKFKTDKSVRNYFDKMVKTQDRNITSQSVLWKSLNDFRMLQKTQDCNLTLCAPLILNIERTRQDLLRFYLKNIVTSSLDFHYILITLRKIQSLKGQYIALCKQLQSGIVQRDVETEILNLQESITDVQNNIKTWKNDEKWLRDRNLSLKKKKVFEVKWMTKSLNQMKIIKKRAGLKKQQKLQLKKKILKG